MLDINDKVLFSGDESGAIEVISTKKVVIDGLEKTWVEIHFEGDVFGVGYSASFTHMTTRHSRYQVNIRESGQSAYPIVRTVLLSVLMHQLADVPAFADSGQVGISLNDVHGPGDSKGMYLVAVQKAFPAGDHHRRHRLIDRDMSFYGLGVVVWH